MKAQFTNPKNLYGNDWNSLAIVKPNEPVQISLEGLSAVHADIVNFDAVEESVEVTWYFADELCQVQIPSESVVMLAKGITYIPESIKSATEKKAIAQALSRPEKFSAYEPY